MTGADELARAVRRLAGRVAHWTPARWSMPLPAAGEAASGMKRAEVVHRLVQEIADVAAAAEGQPRRTVPRVDNDLALPDQLRVMAADLVAAGPDDAALYRAAARISEVARTLGS